MCTATDLTLSYAVYGVGAPAQRAHLSVVPVSMATCTVSYVRQSEWQGGFVASVTATSTVSPLPGWTVVFTFPSGQKITNAWNAVVSQSGAVVTATNLPYASPGAAIAFGFQGTWQAYNESPTRATLNGAPCAMA